MWSKDKNLWNVEAQQSHGVQAVEARREGAAAQMGAFQRAQGATHLMAPVAARKLRQELAKVSNNCQLECLHSVSAGMHCMLP